MNMSARSSPRFTRSGKSGTIPPWLRMPTNRSKGWKREDYSKNKRKNSYSLAGPTATEKCHWGAPSYPTNRTRLDPGEPQLATSTNTKPYRLSNHGRCLVNCHPNRFLTTSQHIKWLKRRLYRWVSKPTAWLHSRQTEQKRNSSESHCYSLT